MHVVRSSRTFGLVVLLGSTLLLTGSANAAAARSEPTITKRQCGEQYQTTTVHRSATKGRS